MWINATDEDQFYLKPYWISVNMFGFIDEGIKSLGDHFFLDFWELV